MEKDIGKINKNDTSDIVIRIDDFGGRKGLTIREFVTSDRYTGFTKAGVRIPAAEFLRFREMINSISLEDMKEEPQTEDSSPKDESKPSSSKFHKPKNQEELPDY
jgi:hypothetical protein